MLNSGPKWDAMLEVARRFVCAKMSYTFTPNEEKVLLPFFTNVNQRVFFMHGLPANVMATLSSMFSRIKNPRGIRGVWVDSFLPGFLACFLPIVEQQFGGDGEKFLREQGIKSLDAFTVYSAEALALYNEFLKRACTDPDYMSHLADSRKVKNFLGQNLDAYGHNSIARMGMASVCFEGISLHAAKSIEWSRLGVGYVELSTRYVDMFGASLYPIWDEFAVWGADPVRIQEALKNNFADYRLMVGEKLDGVFPSYLRERYASLYEGNSGDLERGINGETFDVLGNILPFATLTSVCAAVGGESFPGILKHLLLDSTPENAVLVELVLKEAAKNGIDQFARHYRPSQAEKIAWAYILTETFMEYADNPQRPLVIPNLLSTVEKDTLMLLSSFQMLEGFEKCKTMEGVAWKLFGRHRTEYDKLPSNFELVTVPVLGIMTMRGWRDLQRHGLSTHGRTWLTPDLGFYSYPKPHPEKLDEVFALVARRGAEQYKELLQLGIPPFLLQYILPLGFNVGILYSATLRQHEFVNKQRGKFTVNHEVRQIILQIEAWLRQQYTWWSRFSRSDTTPAYVFARGKEGIPLSQVDSD